MKLRDKTYDLREPESDMRECIEAFFESSPGKPQPQLRRVSVGVYELELNPDNILTGTLSELHYFVHGIFTMLDTLEKHPLMAMNHAHEFTLQLEQQQKEDKANASK